jgi:hypothetical protein
MRRPRTAQPSVNFQLEVKRAVYRRFAETGSRPSALEIAEQLGSTPDSVRSAFAGLRANRVLFLEPDGHAIRMAPPFSGVPTQHVVTSGGVSYFANCAWDALGIPAALHRPAVVHSRCEQSGEPLVLAIANRGPEPSSWLFHCVVPAVNWWDDLVFT